MNNWKSTLLPYVTLPTIRKVTRYARNVTACEPQRERKSRNAAATDSNRTSTSYDPSPPFFRRFPRKPELFIFFFFFYRRGKKRDFQYRGWSLMLITSDSFRIRFFTYSSFFLRSSRTTLQIHARSFFPP